MHPALSKSAVIMGPKPRLQILISNACNFCHNPMDFVKKIVIFIGLIPLTYNR